MKTPLAAALAALLAAAAVAALAVPRAAAEGEGTEAGKKEGAASACVKCHRAVSPGVVADWQASKHAANSVDCATCHGEEHRSPSNADKAAIPTPETCAGCHEERVEQFKRGKHAAAWVAMKAMPTAHAQPVALMDGMKGCGGCHKIGLKTAEETKALKEDGAGYGLASCDACHTRHTFSAAEARDPAACRTCHMGFDHPQWEMYDSSKHGVRHRLRKDGVLPPTSAAPACQTCHMPGGDHGVITSWGFLAVRLPMPEDRAWAADRATILQGLGVLDPAGKPTARLEVVKAGNVARLTEEDWKRPREAMVKACRECHSEGFARGELEKGDRMIREADRLMAEAIRAVAALYADGVLAKPAAWAHPFPDLLAFHDSPTPIEQKLWTMFLEHRMRAFQGTFHASPDYALWYGWSELVRDLTEIRAEAADLREKAGRK
jgi:hypothetical protein